MTRHTYKLIYFGKGGRAEPIRAVFNYLEAPFEDTHISPEEWAEIKPASPTGGLPFLEVDGGKLRLGQSISICRYIAKAYDPELYFAGSTKPEAALCDMWADTFADLFQAGAYVKYMPDEVKESMKTMFTKTCASVLSYADKRLEKTGKYLAGNKLLWCDVYAAAVLSLTEGFVGEAFVEEMQKHKHLVDFYHKMRTSPKMKEYVDESWGETAVKFE